MAQCVLRPLNCTITNRCTLCLVSVFKEKPLHPPSQAQASIQSRPTAEYSYMQSILRLLHNVNFLLLMVTYGKVWPFFLCSYHCCSLPLCALLGQKLAWVVLGEHKDSSPLLPQSRNPYSPVLFSSGYQQMLRGRMKGRQAHRGWYVPTTVLPIFDCCSGDFLICPFFLVV